MAHCDRNLDDLSTRRAGIPAIVRSAAEVPAHFSPESRSMDAPDMIRRLKPEESAIEPFALHSTLEL